MLRIRASQIVLPLLTSLIAGTNVASAGTFYYSDYTVAGEQNITITSPPPGANLVGGMGQIDLAGTNASGVSNGTNILAWCLDVYTYLLGNGYGGSGPFNYTTSQLTGATQNVGFTSTGTGTAALQQWQINDIGALIVYGDLAVNRLMFRPRPNWQSGRSNTRPEPQRLIAQLLDPPVSQGQPQLLATRK